MMVFLSTLTFAGATILDFDLSPAGSGVGVGLSPANEVPAVLNSTGSGNIISGGITYDTETRMLSFAMGYGSAPGFTNLTGAATGVHIHGPAAAGVNAPILFDLGNVHFPAANPALGGVLYGSVVYPQAQVANLLAGRNYVNIHTALNGSGEIRGQLIRVNSAPEVAGPPDANIECGTATYSATISDYDGDAIEAVWLVNGVAVETDYIASTGTPSSTVVTYVGILHDGFNLLTLRATDSAGNITLYDSYITVHDTVAPVIVSTSVNPQTIWPPNHKMIPVRVDAQVTDACGWADWRIVSVTSNQPVNGKGDGNTSPDWIISDDHSLQLRAERTGKSKVGRIYTISIQAFDETGNRSGLKTVTVNVPQSMGKSVKGTAAQSKTKAEEKAKGRGK